MVKQNQTPQAPGGYRVKRHEHTEQVDITEEQYNTLVSLGRTGDYVSIAPLTTAQAERLASQAKPIKRRLGNVRIDRRSEMTKRAIPATS